jgi:hypothetical protein
VANSSRRARRCSAGRSSIFTAPQPIALGPQPGQSGRWRSLGQCSLTATVRPVSGSRCGLTPSARTIYHRLSITGAARYESGKDARVRTSRATRSDYCGSRPTDSRTRWQPAVTETRSQAHPPGLPRTVASHVRSSSPGWSSDRATPQRDRA